MPNDHRKPAGARAHVADKPAEKPPQVEARPEPEAGANALAVHEAKDVVAYDYASDAAKGMENVRSEEIRVPIFRILDPKSPQCKPPGAGGVPGALPGMLINTATGELFDGEKGFDVIPCFRDYKFVEYVDRLDGGGFVGLHEPDDPLVRKLLADQGPRKRLKQRNVLIAEATDQNAEKYGNTEIIETFYLYVMILTDDDRIIYAALPFSSTQIKKYQGFVELTRGIRVPTSDGGLVQPAIWAHVWHVGTKYETNKKGDFYGWVLRPKALPLRECRLTPDDGYYQMGREFYELMQKGLVVIDRAADEKAGGDRASEGGRGPDDEEIPF